MTAVGANNWAGNLSQKERNANAMSINQELIVESIPALIQLINPNSQFKQLNWIHWIEDIQFINEVWFAEWNLID